MKRTEDLTGLVQEVTSTRETAEKIAKEGPSEGADVPRVLAGLIAHLAEQLERFVGGGTSPDTNSQSTNEDLAGQRAQAQIADANN